MQQTQFIMLNLVLSLLFALGIVFFGESEFVRNWIIAAWFIPFSIISGLAISQKNNT